MNSLLHSSAFLPLWKRRRYILVRLVDGRQSGPGAAERR